MIKKYLYNKNFIPDSFVEKKEKDINRRNKRSIILMSVFAVMLLPHTIKFLFYTPYEKIDNNIQEEEIPVNNNLKNESFYKWMDIIKNDTVGTFNNSNATIYIDGMDKFQEILSDKKIIVTNVEDLGDKRFKIQISAS